MSLALALILGAGLSPPPLLIKPDELKAKAAKAVIIDARDAQKYEEGHLPNAISLPWIDLAQMPKSPLARPVPEMTQILTSRGIPSADWVVVYGDGKEGFGEEGRMYWVLSFLGHQKVSVLDGGLGAWKAAGFEVTTEGPDRPSKKFRAAAKPALRIDKPALKAALAAKGVKLLDVRDRDEFEGAIKYGEPRGGHIPGAINLPWKQFLAADGTLLAKADLQKLLEANHVAVTDRVVVYCTGGVRSGFAYLALKAAGVADVANYDGSFWDWSVDSSLPVETKPR